MKLNFDKWISVILAAYFIVVMIIIWSFGNFPLNDDWVHTLTIYTWLNEGQFWYPAWLAPTAHIPILYGIIITKVFGFSFVVLRMTTVVFAWGSCIVLYRLLREYDIPKNISAMGVALLAINPLFLYLSFTFMTDVPALFFLLLSMVFYKKGFENNSTLHLFLGSLSAIFGFYTRQFVILIALAAGIVFISKTIQEKKFFQNGIPFCLAFIIPAILCVGSYGILYTFHAVPGELHARLIPRQWQFFKMFFTQGWYILLYSALFLSPIFLATLVKNYLFFKERIFTFLFGGTVAGIIIACFQKLLFPKFGNIFSWNGIGPSAGQVLEGVLPVWGEKIFYAAANGVAAISLACGSMLAGFLWVRHTKKEHSIQVWIVFCLAYFFLISSLRSFDRYILFLVPFLILFGAFILKQFSWSKITCIFATLLLMIYGVVGTYRYFRWNEVRWSMAQGLVAQGIPAKEIDAGYEWVGWHLYGKEKDVDFQKEDFSKPWYIRELYPSHSRTYILSFSPLKGYTVVTQQGALFLLKKTP